MNILTGESLRDIPIRVLFADQDREHSARYANIVKQAWEIAGNGYDIDILRLSSGKQLLSALKDNHGQHTIIVTEVGLSSCGGLDVKRKIREQGYDCQLIIFSQSDAYILEGYDVDACAYLVKSDTTPRQFLQVFFRAAMRLIEREREYVTFTCGGCSETVLITDIHYFEINNRVVTAHHKHASFDFYATMEQVEGALSGYGFIRIHRKYLVPLVKITQHSRETVTLECGTQLQVGRSFQREVAETFQMMSALIA